jgi:hypothetical protein
MKRYYWKKITNRFSHEKNRLWQYLPVEKVSLYGCENISDVELLKQKIGVCLGPICEVFDQTNIDTDERDIICKEAKAALDHTFDILGSGPTKLPRIPWHADFKSGYTWKKGLFYSSYNVDVKTDEIDGKVPWELSRCQHLLWLGEGYRLTLEVKYAQEIVDEINDWVCENPLMHSVNWTCSMDVAFRAVNWLYAVGLVLESGVVTDDFTKTFIKSLYQHGFYIYNNLEKGIPYSNNHYISDLVGLLYLGSFFRNSCTGRKWYRFARKEYYREVLCQVLPSGANYERSISYHRMVTELFSAAYYLLKRRNEKVPEIVVQRICSMYDFVQAYTKPNGLAPQIEDNDDGRFLPFIKRDFRKHGYLLNQSSLEVGMISAGVGEKLLYNTNNDFSDAGHWIYRFGDAYLFVTNGGQSRFDLGEQVVNTHTHNDLLSFELALGNDDIIIDPGTYQYLYSSDKNPYGRNEFRSTAKHNTIMVDNEEQNHLSQKNLFSIKKNAVIENKSSYHTIDGNLKHSRWFEPNNESLAIQDSVEKQGKGHQLVSRYHFAPDVEIASEGKELKVLSQDYILSINFEVSTPFTVKVVDDAVSPSYGVLQKAKTVELHTLFDNNNDIITKFQWQKKQR